MRRATLLALLLYASMSALLLAGALFRGSDGWRNVGGKDWNRFVGQAQAEVTTIVADGQFPAWNPWRHGGQVSFAQPASMLLSPVTPLALLVGPNAAFKLLLLPLFVAAALGMWALAGELGLGANGFVRALPGAVYLGASVLPLCVDGGRPDLLFGLAILPWLLLASRCAATSRRWLVIGAALEAGLIFCGAVQPFVCFVLLLLLEAAARAFQERKLRPLLATGALVVTGVAFSLVRLVPLLELASELPSAFAASGARLPLGWVAHALLVPAAAGFDGVRSDGAYVGPVVALLAIFGLLLAGRRTWPFALIGAAFVALQPERFMGGVLFALALLSAFGAERAAALCSKWGEHARRFGSALVLAAVVGPLLVVNASITRGAFAIPPPSAPPERPPFKQGLAECIPQQRGGPLLEPVLRNVGNPDGQSDLPSRRAARAEGELGYRGELFLADGHGTVAGTLTPNRIRATAQLDATDLLVVNQTFFPGWRERTSGRECESHAGLIALPLAAGTHAVELEFAPAAIPASAALSLAALAIVGAWTWRRSRVAACVPLGTRDDFAAVGAQLLLVAGVFGWCATRATHGVGAVAPPWRSAAIDVGAPGGPLQKLQVQELQAALAAGPSRIVRLLPGNYAAATITRGVTLVADPPESAAIASLTIEDLPAGEQVTLVGLRFGHAANAGSLEPQPELRILHCEGAVVLQRVVSNPAALPLRLVVTASGQVHGFDLELGGATLQQSRVALVRSTLVAQSGDLEVPAITAIDSLLLLNRCRVEAAGRAPVLVLRGSSTARFAATKLTECDLDATAALVDLDRRPLQFSLDGNPASGRVTIATLIGPPRARGALLVGPRPAFLPLTGRTAGQFQQVAVDAAPQLLPFELDATGRLTLRLPPFEATARPDEGLFLQPYLLEGADPDRTGFKTYALMDGGVVMPTRIDR